MREILKRIKNQLQIEKENFNSLRRIFVTNKNEWIETGEPMRLPQMKKGRLEIEMMVMLDF